MREQRTTEQEIAGLVEIERTIQRPFVQLPDVVLPPEPAPIATVADGREQEADQRDDSPPIEPGAAAGVTE
jgi:hypothetical protein